MKPYLRLVLLILALVVSVAYAEENELQKADKLARDKKYEEALVVLRQYEVSHPTDLEAHDRIQKILKRQNKEQDAIAEYKQRFEKDSTAFNGYLYIRLLKSPVEREAKFQEIIAKDPKSVWGHLGLATSLMDQDRLQDGIDAADRGLENATELAELHYIKARIYRRMQDYPRAAASAREYLRLKPDDETRELAYFYEWMEVSNTGKPEDKLKLAGTWIEKYRSNLESGEGLEGATRLAEVSFIYAGQNQQPARVRAFAELGLKALSAVKPAESGEDHDNYFRIKGSLLALQAWALSQSGSRSRAAALLKEAQKAGPASEMFYFSALAQVQLNKKSEALRNALKAATYPPVYARSHDLAASLWKEAHGDNGAGLEPALKRQREEFAPQRKKRVLSQEVSETFQPFEIEDPSGRSLTEKDLAGQVTLMNFWAVWCPPCREELPHWNEFVAKHGKDPGLRLLAVGDEPWETIQNYLKNHNFSFPVFRDEKYWDQFAVAGIPTLLVIDPGGTIRFRNAGFEEGMEYEETLLWQVDALRSPR